MTRMSVSSGQSLSMAFQTPMLERVMKKEPKSYALTDRVRSCTKLTQHRIELSCGKSTCG